MEQVHTTGIPDEGNQNKLRVEFQAVLVDHEATKTATKDFITTGVEFGDEAYVWVGQAEITTSLTVTVSTLSL